MTIEDFKRILNPIKNNPKALREVLESLEEEFCRRGGGCKSRGSGKCDKECPYFKEKEK
jgi:hypothetical protein